MDYELKMRVFVAIFCLLSTARHAWGWGASTVTVRCHLALKSYINHDDFFSMEALSLEQFKRRRESLERKNLKQQLSRPPNPFLEPKQFVTELLCELRHPRTPQSGVTCLLDSSTSQWRRTLCRSVGAVESTPNQQLAPSLERSMKRKDNQFAILLGIEDEDYLLNFPSDALDYEDGTSWIECRIRSAEEDNLLVVTGWSLEQRSSDGAWLVNGLDWQDFREDFRPGIGREEWERICG